MDIAQLSRSLDIEALCALLPRMRKKLGIGQVELAERVGVTQSSISDWEREVQTPSRRNERRLREILEEEANQQAFGVTVAA